jgi:hypothetical protein
MRTLVIAVGMVLAAIAWRTPSLWACVAFHFVNNAWSEGLILALFRCRPSTATKRRASQRSFENRQQIYARTRPGSALASRPRRRTTGPRCSGR